MHEPWLRSVEWKDLLDLTLFERLHELVICLPWLAASWLAISYGHLSVALATSFMFFLAGLRQVHNAFHHSLGWPRWVDHAVMVVLSVLMLGSMHVVQINHLRHHAHCMAEDDVEAMGARLSALGAILLGPRYPIMLHRKALEIATPSQRAWIHGELAANVAWIAIVFLVLDLNFFRYHVFAMLAGQCLTAFFAVWTTHHDCEPGEPIARSIRNPIKATLAYNMFYHFEHHAFPAVPTCKLPELARRVDAALPNLGLKHVY